MGVLGVGVTGLAPVGRAESREDAFTRLDYEVLPRLLSRGPTFRQELVVELPLPEPPEPVVHGPFCGCGPLSRFMPPPRPPRLPEPVTALGETFRNSRAIEAIVLDPRVRASDYPEDYFGDWTQDDALVTARMTIAGETSMQLLFRLLAEAMGEPDYLSEGEWVEPDQMDISPSDYRRTSGFVSDLSFKFPGEPGARVDIGLAQERVLLQVGDKWETYTLDRWSAAALGEFLATRDRSEGSE